MWSCGGIVRLAMAVFGDHTECCTGHTECCTGHTECCTGHAECCTGYAEYYTGHTECCTDHTECFTGYTECVITALSYNACTNFISCAVLCWARGSRYVAEPAHFSSWAPRGVKSIGPAIQSTICFSNGISLNDIRGGIKCCTCQSKRASSLSDHFHLTIPRVHKMLHLPIKTSLIVKWIRF